MNRKTIQLLLWPVIIILAWLVYRSPISLKEFQEESNYRKSAVIQDLKDIRTSKTNIEFMPMILTAYYLL